MFIKRPSKAKNEEITSTEGSKKTYGSRVKKKEEMDAEEYAKVCERMAMLRDARKKKLNEISTNSRPTKEVIKEVPVEKIVEKIVDRPVITEVIKEVEKIVEKEVPVEKIVEKIVYKHKEKDPFDEDDYKHVKSELNEMKKIMSEMKETLTPKSKEQQDSANKPVTKMIYRPFGGFSPY